MFPLRFRDARFEDATSASPCRLDRRDVDLPHLHHRVKRALGNGRIGIGDRLGQSDWRDLPGQSPSILAPAAFALPAAVTDDCVPVTIRLGLISRRDLKRERFVVLEYRSAVEAEARDADHGELDRQHIPFFPDG